MLRTIFGRGYVGMRKLGVALAGGVVLLVGLAFVVLPGPALLVIPLGLAILAAEFAFARDWLRRLRWHTERLARRIAREPARGEP